MLFIFTVPILAEPPKDLRKHVKTLKNQTFRLKIAVVKLNYPMGKDEHPTNVFADGTVAYRVRTGDILPSEKGKTFGEALGKSLASSIMEGGNKIIGTDPQSFVEQVRSVNKKYAGQVVGVGSRVKIRKIKLEKKYARISIETESEIVTRIYFQFKKKKYDLDDFKQFFDTTFIVGTPSTGIPTDEVPSSD
jgi:hypothetical protein